MPSAPATAIASVKEPHPQQALIDGLRELADWIAAHPQHHVNADYLPFNMFAGGDREDFAAMVRAMGHTEKDYRYDTTMVCGRMFGPLRLDANIVREAVCTRRKVGEKIIPATPERVEPVYEWDCAEPILAGGGDHAEA